MPCLQPEPLAQLLQEPTQAAAHDTSQEAAATPSDHPPQQPAAASPSAAVAAEPHLQDHHNGRVQATAPSTTDAASRDSSSAQAEGAGHTRQVPDLLADKMLQGWTLMDVACPR